MTSTAAATALLAGAGAAIAAIPDAVGHARHSGPVGTSATDVAGSVDLHAAQARARSNARDIAALQRAIAAAQAELAKRRAAAAAAGGSSSGNATSSGAQPSWSHAAGTTQAGDDRSSGEASTPPPPSSSASSSTPPPVQATTGASGSTAPTGEDDHSREPGDD